MEVHHRVGPRQAGDSGAHSQIHLVTPSRENISLGPNPFTLVVHTPHQCCKFISTLHDT